MSTTARWRKPFVMHAVRVALVATLIIGAMYVGVVVAINVFDQHRLYAQVDDRLHDRLEQAARAPGSAGAIASYDNAHDVDDSPVFFWHVGPSGRVTALTFGAPLLSLDDLAKTSPSVSGLGSANFRLDSIQVGDSRIVAGQSLADSAHVLSDLVALEFLAGPVLLVAVFLGTLLVGLKAAGPVEVARRRQLEFTADASHELRTPLSVIEAEVSLALSASRTIVEYRDTLLRVSRESGRLRDIVEDLLWLSRFDSEPPPPGDGPVDVWLIVAACAERFEAVAERSGLSLSAMKKGDGASLINAPADWVDRLAGVLVDNACRYASHNGEVRITVWVQGNRVRLTVEDDGPGIAPEERSTLFDRFRRATDEGNGAGLGLAIGDAVVRTTGGEWLVGRSALGGARMEVDWHRSTVAREVGQVTAPTDLVEAERIAPDQASILG
jgi:signal transduction histidine kinase